MKYKLIKLTILFLTIGVLTSSRENEGIKKANECFNCAPVSLQDCNEYAVNIPCKKIPAVQLKKEDTKIAPATDNEVYLSPISRFILLQ